MLKTNAIPGNANDGSIVNIREALDLRHSSTLELMKSLENAIDAQRIRTENFAHLLEGKSSAEGWEPGKTLILSYFPPSLSLYSLITLQVLLPSKFTLLLCYYVIFGACIRSNLIILSLRFSDAIIILSKIDDMMKEEANYLHRVIDVLHLKHKEYANEIEACNQRQSADQSELKRLEGICNICFHEQSSEIS